MGGCVGAPCVKSGEGGAANGGKGAGAESETFRLAEARAATGKRASKHETNIARDKKPHQGALLDAAAGDIHTLAD